MDRAQGTKPAAVPVMATQAGEVRARWAWTEPAVWTERMLTALEQGVKGSKWFSLIDKVYRPANLLRAFARVKANKGVAGVDHQTIEMFEQHLEANLERLAVGLQDGSYRPQALRREWIPKPGSSERRPLGIPTVRDRVVETAMRAVLEPIFERIFAAHSYGFRPGRGCKDALRRVNHLLREGYHWVVDADLKSYFDTIPHEQLLVRVKEQVADGAVLALIEAYLHQGVLEAMKLWQPEAGTPQGAVISPLLSNIYLNPLDHLLAQQGIEMVRYADDFVIVCRSEAEAQRALAQVQQWTAEAGLTLHPEKTRIVDVTKHGGFDFLGYHFERGYKWPRDKSLKKLKHKIRSLTKRNNGQSLQVIISRVNRVTQGWFAYFKHSHYPTFRPLDQWIRTRLRSILRKRGKRRGRARGSDQRRWPNAFFATQGLFSLATAPVLRRQSSRR
ncbi:MAG TPA: group II intron reverse transcriptase/maturase [Pyrinomonadaceae bacterium]|nr:group II intron reverse transcriptase/maturase [Pyrinomonadaceae bacterium]